MEKIFLIFLLIFNIIKINSQNDQNDIFDNNLNNEENSLNNNRFNVISILYELTYNDISVLKVIIKTHEQFEKDISFQAYLKSEEDNKEYLLNCTNTYYDTIECLSGKNITFNTEDKYYFSYKKGKDNLYFDENTILEDEKRISLVFKPEIPDNQRIFKDSRKIIVNTNKKMVNGGYLYILRKSKNILNKPKDGFNKYIEMNNYISRAGLLGYRPQSTLIAYEEAIRRGFHMVDASLAFSKDKIPVISNTTNLEKISNGKGEISSKTFEELDKLDFGTIFNVKYKGEKILTFENLLKLCKENEVIIDLDLSHLDSKQYFENDEYAKIILNLIEKYDMFNSIFFNEERPEVILKLKQIKNDISLSLNNITIKENIEKVKDLYKDSKRIIYNLGIPKEGNIVREDAVKYGLSLGKKIKASKVDNLSYSKKIQLWGVNYIATDYLHPFLIKNDKEEPIPIRCTQHEEEEDTSECEIEYDIKLIDNEKYNIYYSNNIYNISEDINPEPIGEFQYVDTNILHELYYSIIDIDFDNGIIKLNTSNRVKSGESIPGVIGPNYDNVAECYQYNFICIGNNLYTVNCKILKNEEDKVEFKGNYIVYSLEDYSLNPEEVLIRKNKKRNKKIATYTFVLILILIIICIMIYLIKFRNKDKFNKIKIVDNSFMPDSNLYR